MSRKKPSLIIEKNIRIRIYIISALLWVSILGLVVVAYRVQITHGKDYVSKADLQHLRNVAISSSRGIIYDRNQSPLAVTDEVYSVIANPKAITDPIHTAKKLTTLINDLNVKRLEKRLASSRYFAWIKRHIDNKTAQNIKKEKLKGIQLIKEPRRFYPERKLAGTVLGFADRDNNGIDGIELSLDSILNSSILHHRAVRDVRGRTMLKALSSVDEITHTEPSVTLTLDRVIQFIVERALQEAIQKYEASSGSVVIINVADGSLLALASFPTYNPNNPSKDVLLGARNRTITDTYETGSVMKVFTLASALEAGVVTPDTRINVHNGRFRVSTTIIRDVYKNKSLTIGGILKRSSNVGSVKVAQQLGAQPLYESLVAFGFGKKTGIRLPGERHGKLKPFKTWSTLDLASISFGYGITTTVLQLASAISVIGAKGILHTPHIIQSMTNHDGIIEIPKRKPSRSIVSEKTASQMLTMLHSVFDKGKQGGTAQNISIKGYDAGGKTGTSFKVDPDTKQYDHKRYLASFIGLAPIQNPLIAIAILIDEPKGKFHSGSTVAGPVFKRIVEETLRYLNAPMYKQKSTPTTTNVTSSATIQASIPLSHETPVLKQTQPALNIQDTTVVPDFTGMNLRQALTLSKKTGLSITTEGTGLVIDQSIAFGTAITTNTCHLILRHPEHP